MIKRNFYFLVAILIFSSSFIAIKPALALPVGSLLYRTSQDGLMYGYNANKIWPVRSGHVGMYLGEVGGKKAVIEANEGLIQYISPDQFTDLATGEKYLGAKIPQAFNLEQIRKLKDLAQKQKGKIYDFNFREQKGPGDSEFTCVGLTEKLYESLSTPNLDYLIYDPIKYAVDITYDGYDDESVVDPGTGDVFSKTKEFSRIHRIPILETIGTFLGKEYQGERYWFFPYTQYLQSTLKEVPTDIAVSTYSKQYRNSKIANALKVVEITGTGLVSTAIHLPSYLKDQIVSATQEIGDFFSNIFNKDEFKLAQVVDLNQGQNSSDQDNSQIDNNQNDNFSEQPEKSDMKLSNKNQPKTTTSTTNEPPEKEEQEEKPELENQTSPVQTCSFNTSKTPTHQGGG